MLPRHPLRFALCDNPGAGKTIMRRALHQGAAAARRPPALPDRGPGGLEAQWQDELSERFGLSFAILTRDMIEASATADPFADHDLLIARLDHLAWINEPSPVVLIESE